MNTKITKPTIIDIKLKGLQYEVLIDKRSIKQIKYKNSGKLVENTNEYLTLANLTIKKINNLVAEQLRKC